MTLSMLRGIFMIRKRNTVLQAGSAVWRLHCYRKIRPERMNEGPVARSNTNSNISDGG
jgi:hypothetical protein